MKKCIVVGSGILGASTAYYLTELGIQPLIVDRPEPSRATTAAAGIICPWTALRRNKAWYELARQGVLLYEELIPQLENEFNEETGYKKTGALALRSDVGILEKMVKRTELRKLDAPEIGEIRMLNPEQIQEEYPLLAPGYSGVHVSGAGKVNGEKLRQALLNASIKKGAHLIQDDVSLISERGQVCGVHLENINQKIYAEQIILTTGAWEKEILDLKHLQSPIKAQKAQLIHFDIGKDIDIKQYPVIMPPSNQYMLFDEYTNTVTAGTTYETNANFTTYPSASGVHEILEKSFALLPLLETANIKNISVGFRPVSPDSIPYFGRLTDYGEDRVLIANGLGASGLNTGPLIGKTLAQLVANQTPETLDLNNYKPSLITL